MDERAILDVAVGEVIQREWGSTQQCLSLNRIQIDETGVPVVARADAASKAEACFVYFPIMGQPYFFVVVVRRNSDGKPEVSATYPQERVSAYLSVSAPGLTPEEISRRLDLAASGTSPEKTVTSDQDPQREREQALWQFEPDRNLPGSVEEKLKRLLVTLRPARQRIAALAQTCDVSAVVRFEGWRDPQFGSLELTPHTLRGLRALRAGLTLELHTCGPEMPD